MRIPAKAWWDVLIAFTFVLLFFGCVYAAKSYTFILGGYKEALRAAAEPVPGIPENWKGKTLEEMLRERGDDVGASIEIDGE